jgi:hypothetical protein
MGIKTNHYYINKLINKLKIIKIIYNKRRNNYIPSIFLKI